MTPGGAVKSVTTISSKDRPNASSAPANIAPRSSGRVMWRNVTNVSAPRSIDASSAVDPIRRSRATTLLYMTTMQKVACETATVQMDSEIPRIVRKATTVAGVTSNRNTE